MLQRHVEKLALEIGERNFVKYASLLRAAGYIKREFESAGYEVRAQDYQVDGQTYTNLSAQLPGSSRSETRLVVGAHYDSIVGSPGANDNASGLAAILSLATLLASKPAAGALRFVAFVNEEPPFFRSADMGSYVYARDCKDVGDAFEAMLCLDTVGYFSDQPSSQKETLGQLSDVANFAAFVSGQESAAFTQRCVSCFSESGCDLPIVGMSASGEDFPYVNYSDHWPFSVFGWPALMVTDTGPLRYPHYHTGQDTPDKICYAELATLVTGLGFVLESLLG